MNSKGRTITNRGNQTLDIAVHSRHHMKNVPAGLLSIFYPITQLNSNIYFIWPSQYLTALWYFIGDCLLLEQDKISFGLLSLKMHSLLVWDQKSTQ